MYKNYLAYYLKLNLFSRNSKIFEEGLKRPDSVVEKYDDEKNFQYASCIEKIKSVGKSTRLH